MRGWTITLVESIIARDKNCTEVPKCLRACQVCQHNQWIEDHTCRWCDTLNFTGGHTNEFGHFCGCAEDSKCAWLFREWIARRQ